MNDDVDVYNSSQPRAERSDGAEFGRSNCSRKAH
jgi:hypothetical protein